MKTYFFLKLGITVLMIASASPRSQVSENFSASRDNRRYSNNNQRNQNIEQTTVPSSQQRGDTSTNIPDYQGVMGKPGVDFPVLKFIPRTKFTCRGKKSGYYADLETNCQVFHICDEGRKVSFLCPNGTIFQQSDLICDWWFKVDCAMSPTLYEESAEQLHEENLRRKENRKVQQQQERRTNKVHHENNNRQQQHFDRVEYSTKQRKQYPNQPNNNYVKKDINHYTTTHQQLNYNRGDDYNNFHFKETQIPSETASFVSNRYTSEHQQKYLKSLNLNDVTVANDDTTLSSKAYNTNDEFSSSVKTSTEKIVNRGSRTFNNKIQYRNQVLDQIKTTTQHTIYSPTVPPFTATSRYTTKIPAPFATSTETYKPKPSTIRSKPINGFYITKDLNTKSTTDVLPTTEFTSPTSVYVKPHNVVFSSPRQIYTPSSFVASTEANVKVVDSLRRTDIVNRPLAGSDIITRFTATDYSTTTTATTEFPNRNAKQIEFSTVAPFETTSLLKTIIPSIPTPFKLKSEIVKESSSTHKYNEFAYLPKSTELPNTVPTPKPTIPTDTFATDSTTVTDNLSNMLKTLEEIEGENPLLNVENTNSRPGLHIPPSAGPKTLHSLAIYFATALDNLVTSNDTTANSTERYPSTSKDGEGHVTLLSRMTQDKYNLLFDETHNETINATDEPVTEHDDDDLHESTKISDLDLKSFVENDLEVQQSRGPVSGAGSSTTPRIRQLAQVFTQALSAYLDDPDTFKKVLEEIRPTEPPPLFTLEDLSDTTTTPPTIIPTEYKSYTKEEDEVLDFSDADKSSTYKPFIDNNIRTTQPTLHARFSPTEAYLNEISTDLPLEKENNINATLILSKRIPTPNPLALDLNNGLKLSTSADALLEDIDDETFVEDNNTESDDYFPFNTGTDEEDARRKATAKPYGAEVKPLSISTQIRPTDSLLPPFKVSLNHKTEQINSSFIQNEEYLQSAHSQSFVSHNNNNKITTERDGKSLIFNSTEISYSTTTDDYRDSTTIFTTPFDYLTSTLAQYNEETTRYLTTNRQTFDDTTTTEYFESTTMENPTTYTYESTEQTTISKAVPNDHWSTSPEVTKLWESTLYVDPLIINRNLGDTDSNSDEPTTYRPDFSTQPYRTTTLTDYDDEVDLKFTSTTTDEPATSTITFPSTVTTDVNEFYSTIIDLGIHSLLNTTEMEIAHSQAQQIFGKLNSTEQDLLIEKMKEAESNSTVRRLVLLLVSTCDASLSNNKTVQETRNSILNALLNIPSNTNPGSGDSHEVNTRFGKQLTIKNKDEVHLKTTITTTTLIPETTSRFDKIPRKSAVVRSAIEAPTKVVDVKDVHQDTRALELLRSLYSLAAKWGKK